MKLPNFNRAVVDIAKLRDYSLNSHHKDGKFKSRVFRSALGITQADWPLLRQWLLEAAWHLDVVPQAGTAHGDRYIIDFVATNNGRSANIRSAWIIRKHEDFPRLTTCYVI
jgi:hypothetical protein